jgi:hypothetical protein
VAITQRTIKMLWGRAAARCAFGECQRLLVIDETEADEEALIGEMCHLAADSPDGPRGDAPVPMDRRDDYDNLILLCRNHHAEIDAQPATYTIERLRTLKSEHEKWVRAALPGYDRSRQRDDETYAGYVDEWAQRCDLDRWTAWSSWVLGGGQPRIATERDEALDDLRRWLLTRIWPGRYAALERAFTNFRLVLGDFQNTFREHAEKPDASAEWLITAKFYEISVWDDERYNRLARQFDFHVDLVEDLMLELTRAANLICDEVRAALLPAFPIREGRLSASWGPDSTLGWREAVVQYTEEEVAAEMPYPGLERFKTVRADRDWHFGSGTTA